LVTFCLSALWPLKGLPRKQFGRRCFYSRAYFRASWPISLLRGAHPLTRSQITVTTALPIERQETSIHCFPPRGLRHPLGVGGHRQLLRFKGTAPSACLRHAVSAMASDQAASQAAVGKYLRAMEALNSNPVVSCRGVHEKLSRLLSQDDDDLADVKPYP
jgi:hypothetical protein